MKNHLLLSITLLFSLPLIAKMTYEEAEQRLNIAQNRIKQIKSELHALDRKAQGSHRALQSISGKPEYGEDLERRNALVRARIDRYNQLHAQLEQARTNLQKVLNEVGHKYSISSERDGEYRLSRPTKATRAPSSEPEYEGRSVSR